MQHLKSGKKSNENEEPKLELPGRQLPRKGVTETSVHYVPA